MRLPWLLICASASALAIVFLGPLLVLAFPLKDLILTEAHGKCSRTPSISSGQLLVFGRDNDHIHLTHHPAPLAELNETELLRWHAPTSPSFWSLDFENRDPTEARFPHLMALHVVFMLLAFFVTLPVGIAMRAVNHAWHGFVMIAFYGLCIIGCAFSALYRKFTPNMYEGSTHAPHGYFVLGLSLFLSAIDIARFFVRLYAFLRSRNMLALKSFWRNVILGRQVPSVTTADYTLFEVEEPSNHEVIPMKFQKLAANRGPIYVQRNQPIAPVQAQYLDDGVDDAIESWATMSQASQSAHHHTRSSSSETITFGADSSQRARLSDETMHDSKLPALTELQSPLISRMVQGVLATLERSLLFAAFGMVLSGIVVYTGGCRQSYVNGCLAHLIKGGIFWCYGLISFARYLGSFSERGWAWNVSPSGEHVSVEFVESFVIFLYGITNTWMERFGAHRGDPYTTKQVQHISIAVMFWFAGLVGMGIESKRVRRWLAGSVSDDASRILEHQIYQYSFNPFPALVIGVTGIAMSYHAQTYLFQVQIHKLWGWLLLGSSILRCLTYFFAWLGPPRSIIPSRPPTEALGSFFLACGGLMFIFSTEEVTIAAMRRGRDDAMMFLNVAVAVTCFAFCWILCIVALKGWLKSRRSLRPDYPI